MFRTAFSRCPLDGEPLQVCDVDPLTGREFADRYVIEECIGEGAMGRVYRARHNRLHRQFAVKVLFGDHAADSKMRSRFNREAQAASLLDHPNVISVTDFDETEEGLLYLVMDLVAGPSLTDVCEAEAPLSRERVINIVRQLGKGLAHAHRKGLIHRDFKGENVIVTTDGDGAEVPKIVDFGIAMMLERKTHKLTTEGMVLGTPAVMSPEQASGDKVDLRTDLFALGVVMYEMMAGVLPFEGTPMQIARQNLMDKAPRIADRVPGLFVDPALEDLAHWLMAKRAADRPSDARQVVKYLDDLEGVQNRSMATPLPVPRDYTPTPRPAVMYQHGWDGTPSPIPPDPTGPNYAGVDAAPTIAQRAHRFGDRKLLIGAVLGVLAVAAIATIALLGSSGDKVAESGETEAVEVDRSASSAGKRQSEGEDDPAAKTKESDDAPDNSAPVVQPIDDPAVASGVDAGAGPSDAEPNINPQADADDSPTPAPPRDETSRKKDKRKRKERERKRSKRVDKPKPDPPAPEPKVPTSSALKSRWKALLRKANALDRSAPGYKNIQKYALKITWTNFPLKTEADRLAYQKKLNALSGKIRRAAAATKK